MAAGKDQLEALVLDRRIVVELVHRRLRNLEQSGLLSQRPLPPDAVNGPVTGTREQPGAWVIGNAIARPPFGGHRERLLSGLLGEVEVAEETDQRGEHPAPLLAEDLLQRRYRSTSERTSEGCSTTGRTSMAPPSRTAGIREASSIASSRLSASKM